MPLPAVRVCVCVCVCVRALSQACNSVIMLYSTVWHDPVSVYRHPLTYCDWLRPTTEVISKLHGTESFLRSWQSLTCSWNFVPRKEIVNSSQCSQKPAAWHHHESNESRRNLKSFFFLWVISSPNGHKNRFCFCGFWRRVVSWRVMTPCSLVGVVSWVVMAPWSLVGVVLWVVMTPWSLVCVVLWVVTWLWHREVSWV